MANARPKLLTIRLSLEEAKRFERVATKFGIPISAMVRMLVKEYDDTRPKPAGKR